MDFLTIVDYQTATICQTSTTEPEEAETNNNLRKDNPKQICILHNLDTLTGSIAFQYSKWRSLKKEPTDRGFNSG